MAKIEEHEVVRDADGRIVETHIVRPRRSGGGFGWGMLLGVLLIAGGVVYFAYNQGSFEQAGAEMDQATAQAEQEIDATAENVEARIDNATDDTAQN